MWTAKVPVRAFSSSTPRCDRLPTPMDAKLKAPGFARIAHAVGGRGANRDYLYATAAHLADLGIGDADLEWLAARVQALCPP